VEAPAAVQRPESSVRALVGVAQPPDRRCVREDLWSGDVGRFGSAGCSRAPRFRAGRV